MADEGGALHGAQRRRVYTAPLSRTTVQSVEGRAQTLLCCGGPGPPAAPSQASALPATELTNALNGDLGVWKNGGNAENGGKGRGNGGKWGIVNRSEWKI